MDLGAFGVMALSPVVSSAGLSEDEVVGAEELAEGTGTDGGHGTGLEIHEDRAGDVTATSSFVVVDVNALELEVGVSVVRAGGVNSIFVGDNLPELGTDLVTALTTLDMNDFTHSKVSNKLFIPH